MNMDVLLVLYVLFWLVSCATAFLIGYLWRGVPNRKQIIRDPPALTKEEENKLRKDKREYENFMTYNGDEQ